MKKYLSIIALAALTLTGCDESLLEIPQKGVISTETFYKTDADAESALVTMYADALANFTFMPEVTGYNTSPVTSMLNYLGDDIVTAGQNKADNVAECEYHTFRYATNCQFVDGGYKAYYRAIHKANLLINNFEVDGATLTPVQKRCIAEARAFRAYCHLMLGICWGTPPIVETVLTGADQPANSKSQADVMQWVANEIDKALPDLEERKSPTDLEGAVKVTKGFANAVKGKALVWKGDYAAAKVALKAVIDSKKYELISTDRMEEILHYSGTANEEVVMELSYVWDDMIDGWTAYQRQSGNQPILWNWRWDKMEPSNDPRLMCNGWGEITPSELFINTLIAHDGMDSPRRKAWVKTYDEVLYDFSYPSDGDAFTPGKTDAKSADAGRGIRAADGLYGSVGYFMWKRNVHADDDNNTAAQAKWGFPLMRYPEVLLLYAECCAQTGDADGLKVLNQIQDRAGSAHRSTACTLAEVQEEKMIECWLEGLRFWDLVRWNKTETLEKQGASFPNFCDAMFTKGEPVHRGYIERGEEDWCTKQYGAAVGFKKGQHELLPFPYTEMVLNRSLVQNPGWQKEAE